MITDLKEINKYLRAAKQNFNKAIELAKKNIIVGEINFHMIEKTRKPRKARGTQTDSTPTIIEKPKRGRKPKNLPDLDKNNPFYGKKDEGI